MKNKRLILIISALTAILIAFAVLCWFVPIFKVKNIEVSGTARLSPEDVVTASGLTEGENWLRVSESGAAKEVAKLPWVKTVTVNRKLPNTITIDIAERKAMIFAARSDGDHLIDNEGKVIVIGEPSPDTVEVTGTSADDSDSLAVAVGVLSSIEAKDHHLLTLIDSIDAPSKFEISIKLKDGKKIYWGSEENSHDKAVAFSSVVNREGASWNISSPPLVTVR